MSQTSSHSPVELEPVKKMGWPEFVGIFVILLALFLVSMPLLKQMATSTQQNAQESIVNSIQVSINSYKANALANSLKPVLPQTLDQAQVGSCTAANPCFGEVLTPALTDNKWIKVDQNHYGWASQPGKKPSRHYTYDAEKGLFKEE